MISPPSPDAGTWALEVIEANDHYRLDKQSGADRGIYLTWLSTGTATVTFDVTLAGSTSPPAPPIDVTLTNELTGERFLYPGVVNGFVASNVPSGSYAVTARASGGGAYPVDVLDTTVDLWCDLETSLFFDVPNRPPTVTLPPAFDVDEGPPGLILTPTANDDDGDPLTFTWELVSGTGSVTPIGIGDTASYVNDDGPATAVVRVTVADPYGGTASAETTIPVHNVAPVVNALRMRPSTRAACSPRRAASRTPAWTLG